MGGIHGFGMGESSFLDDYDPGDQLDSTTDEDYEHRDDSSGDEDSKQTIVESMTLSHTDQESEKEKEKEKELVEETDLTTTQEVKVIQPDELKVEELQVMDDSAQTRK